MIIDQAERLRRLIKRKELGIDVDLSTFMEGAPVRKKRLVAFLSDPEEALATSTLLANLGVAMARLGKRVVILDSSSGRVDAGIPLGISVKATFDTLMDGLCDIQSVLYSPVENVTFVKMGSVLERWESMDFNAKKQFFDHWMSLEEAGDIILLQETSPTFAFTLKELIVVFSPAKSIVASAYTRLKHYYPTLKGTQLGMIINMAATEKEASATADRFMTTVKRFLQSDLEYLGCVVQTPEVIKSIKARTPFVRKYPYSNPSSAVHLLANRLVHGLPVTGKGIAHV